MHLDKRVNRKKLNAAADDDVRSLNSIYANLSAHISAYVNVAGVKYIVSEPQARETLKGALQWLDVQVWALAQVGLWFERDFKAWIEYTSQKTADRFAEAFNISGTGDFSRSTLDAKLQSNIDAMSKKKENKEYFKKNADAMTSYKEQLLNIIDASPLRTYLDNAPDKAKASIELQTALYNLGKWIVSATEREKMESINGDVKLTKAGLYARAWVLYNTNKSFVENMKALPKVFGLWVNLSLSSFLVKYAPDKEKYNYMDESLKNGNAMQSVDVKLSDGVANLAKKLDAAYNIRGADFAEEDGKLVITYDEKELSGDKKPESLLKLLNIYVSDTEKKNISMSPDGKKLTIGNVSAINYANRSYFADEAHYLSIGKGGLADKKRVQDAKDLPATTVVEKIDTEARSNRKLERKLAEQLAIDAKAEWKADVKWVYSVYKGDVIDASLTAQITKASKDLVTKYIRVNESNGTYETQVYDSDKKPTGNREKFEYKQEGIKIGCDDVWQCTFEKTKQIWVVEYSEVGHLVAAPESKDIPMSYEAKSAYDASKELFKIIDFGPLVWKYKHEDPKWFGVLYKNFVTGTHEVSELSKILTKMKNKLTADYVVGGDVTKAQEYLQTVINNLGWCSNPTDATKPNECKLLSSLFMAKLPQSIAHAAKSWELLMADKFAYSKKWADGVTRNLDAIKDLWMKDYLDKHIWRKAGFEKVMNKAHISKNEQSIIMDARDNLLASVKDNKEWKAEKNASVLVFNANMTPGIDEFNLIPPGEAMLATVNWVPMIQEIKNDNLRDTFINKLKAENYGWYLGAFINAYPALAQDPKETAEQKFQKFLRWEEIIVWSQKLQNVGIWFSLMYYGWCFNESLGFDMKIKVTNNGQDIKWGFSLNDLWGMELTTDRQTLTADASLIEKRKTVNIWVDATQNDKDATVWSAGWWNSNGGGGSWGGWSGGGWSGWNGWSWWWG
jgi:hypothetical protein